MVSEIFLRAPASACCPKAVQHEHDGSPSAAGAQPQLAREWGRLLTYDTASATN